MKILIVDTFYGPYLERLYASGELIQQPWSLQHKHHFAGGFGTMSNKVKAQSLRDMRSGIFGEGGLIEAGADSGNVTKIFENKGSNFTINAYNIYFFVYKFIH